MHIEKNIFDNVFYTVGYKISAAEIPIRKAPPGLLREPGSTGGISTVPLGLLREPGSTAISKRCSARTPTGAGLRLRHQNGSAQTPTGAGLHLRHQSGSARAPTEAGLQPRSNLNRQAVTTIMILFQVLQWILRGSSSGPITP